MFEIVDLQRVFNFFFFKLCMVSIQHFINLALKSYMVITVRLKAK
jgi:hypothetical protein